MFFHDLLGHQENLVDKEYKEKEKKTDQEREDEFRSDIQINSTEIPFPEEVSIFSFQIPG
jgi:hypothetical protein